MVTYEEEQEFINQLEELDKLNDPEVAHGKADEILLEVCRKHGHGRINTAYRKIQKWYA